MPILVIDIGSSSVRTMLFDNQARAIENALVQKSIQFVTSLEGKSSIDANYLRLEIETCIDGILKHPSAKGIRAVGMATFAGNLIGLDVDGNPLMPLMTYADTRSSSVAERLIGQLDMKAIHQRTGVRVHSAYYPARLAWLQQAHPDLFSEVACWADMGAYCLNEWTGHLATSYSLASWNGLLNRQFLTWDTIWLDFLGISAEHLPQLRDYSDTQQNLKPIYAERWPQLAEIPFFLAVGDGAAANIGVGASSLGKLALTIGTTGAVRIISNQPLPEILHGLWGYRVSADLHLIGGATSEGGNIYAWLKCNFQLPDTETIEKELSTRTPDRHGLTFLPLLAGERSPGWATNASGTIHGLRLNTSSLDILQAAQEAIAIRLATIARQLDDGTAPVLAGGQALKASPAWAQMIANAMNRNVHLIDSEETTARGVAMLALKALDGCEWDSFDELPATITWPNIADVLIFERAAERQRNLYERLISDTM